VRINKIIIYPNTILVAFSASIPMQFIFYSDLLPPSRELANTEAGKKNSV
jgi:hypothetical protein